MKTSFKKGASRRAVRADVSGIVSPAGWDEDGRVVAVCIVTDQGDPCFVLPGRAGDEVREHLRRYVSASGRLEKRGSLRYLLVESVEPVPDPEGAPDRS
jgi:hypothetical protein